ncbi:hypothetical protein RHODGE_RHODGE_02850 [Rhodoplanes serenus]|uniref:Uncharacterized protein n=1 Tax=Rhodoplanes serenus TaxID=200615 RepID=A0A447CWU2_9BRAD|nr:hypothetical protein [Rhodoplanes serenus]VCU09681.1 hypothetical protein RHODGE_RHODGE_02850 [Rhodoplanes serenus]
MSEAIWYAMYDEDGSPPKCDRLTRMPRVEQLGMALDLAIALYTGAVSYRPIGQISATGETYWYWPDRRRKYDGWWLLPARTVTLARRATRYAEARAMEPPPIGPARAGDLRAYLASLPGAPPSAAERPEMDVRSRVIVHLERLRRAAHRARRRVERHGYIPEYMPAPRTIEWPADPWRGRPKWRRATWR